MKKDKVYKGFIKKLKSNENSFYAIVATRHVFTDGVSAIYTRDPELTEVLLRTGVSEVRSTSALLRLSAIRDTAIEEGHISESLKSLTKIELCDDKLRFEVRYISHSFCDDVEVGTFSIFNSDYMPDCPDMDFYINAKNPLSQPGLLTIDGETDMILSPIRYNIDVPGDLGFIAKSIIDTCTCPLSVLTA